MLWEFNAREGIPKVKQASPQADNFNTGLSLRSFWGACEQKMGDNLMRKTQYGENDCVSTKALVPLCACAIALLLSGCGDKFWDPTQVGRFRPVPAVNVILDSLGVAEETPAAWETGEDPRPTDVVAYDVDYVFGPGDVIQVNIFELLTQGQMYINQFVITETGKLSIPDVGVVEAAGLTESQLEEEIKQILSPTILKEPSVSVILVQSQSRIFSILGNGVPAPGRYGIPRYDYRLADALATAGGISQFNISYIYVSRPITGQEALTEEVEAPAETAPAPVRVEQAPSVEAPPARPTREDMLEIIAPSARRIHKSHTEPVVATAEMVTDEELEELGRIAPPEDMPEIPFDARKIEPYVSQPERREPAPTTRQDNGEQAISGESRIEWIFQDGRWIPVQISPSAPTRTAPEQRRPTVEERGPGVAERAAGWGEIGPSGTQRRVIKIPSDRLLSGDTRYNIVIKPGDNIHVPVDIIGEFCIMGNVNAQGFINITGRPMTLKMAIAAAGGLGPLAWPKKCEVVRRIGKKREEIVMVDLDKISMGEQPDFFIKPNDLINVGTHPTSRYRAILRNAFRATYGFGLIYDRNYADRDFGTSRPFPQWEW
jgi:polysaccharide export outer membrane protein